MTEGQRPIIGPIIHVEPRPASRPHPCDLGYHRWAWLRRGGQACYDCGRRR